MFMSTCDCFYLGCFSQRIPLRLRANTYTGGGRGCKGCGDEEGKKHVNIMVLDACSAEEREAWWEVGKGVVMFIIESARTSSCVAPNASCLYTAPRSALHVQRIPLYVFMQRSPLLVSWSGSRSLAFFFAVIRFDHIPYCARCSIVFV